MTFLTPLGGLAAFAVLLPLGAAARGRIRSAALARALGLDPPTRLSLGPRSAAAAAAVALLGLAAAQPALSDEALVPTRTDVAVLFVLDTSRSMAASLTPTSPTRLARAIKAAVALRAAIPEVPAGVATFTDRVLPDMLPVPDVAGFDAVLERAVDDREPAACDAGRGRDELRGTRGHRHRQLLRAPRHAPRDRAPHRRGEQPLRPERARSRAGRQGGLPLPRDSLLERQRVGLRRERTAGAGLPP